MHTLSQTRSTVRSTHSLSRSLTGTHTTHPPPPHTLSLWYANTPLHTPLGFLCAFFSLCLAWICIWLPSSCLLPSAAVAHDAELWKIPRLYLYLFHPASSVCIYPAPLWLPAASCSHLRVATSSASCPRVPTHATHHRTPCKQTRRAACQLPAASSVGNLASAVMYLLSSTLPAAASCTSGTSPSPLTRLFPNKSQLLADIDYQVQSRLFLNYCVFLAARVQLLLNCL